MVRTSQGRGVMSMVRTSQGDVLMKLKMDWNGNNREGKLVTGGGS